MHVILSMSSLGDVARRVLAAPVDGGPVLAKRSSITQAIDQELKNQKEETAIAHAKKVLAAQQSLTHRLAKRPQKSKVQPDLVLETNLRKIATKGVVQLFNAVRAAQRSADVEPAKKKAKMRGKTDDEASKSSVRASAPLDLSRETFFDILRRGNTTGGNTEPASAPFLRDDYVFSKSKAKHWGQPLEGEEEKEDNGAAPGDAQDDSDDDQLGEL